MTEDERIHMSAEEISAILKSFRPIEEFDKETGIIVSFMKMDCLVCKNEQSMIMLLNDKGKLCTRDFYCHACNVGSATQGPMKRYIEYFRKERNPATKIGMVSLEMNKELTIIGIVILVIGIIVFATGVSVTTFRDY